MGSGNESLLEHKFIVVECNVPVSAPSIKPCFVLASSRHSIRSSCSRSRRFLTESAIESMAGDDPVLCKLAERRFLVVFGFCRERKGSLTMNVVTGDV